MRRKRAPELSARVRLTVYVCAEAGTKTEIARGVVVTHSTIQPAKGDDDDLRRLRKQEQRKRPKVVIQVYFAYEESCISGFPKKGTCKRVKSAHSGTLGLAASTRQIVDALQETAASSRIERGDRIVRGLDLNGRRRRQSEDRCSLYVVCWRGCRRFWEDRW